RPILPAGLMMDADLGGLALDRQRGHRRYEEDHREFTEGAVERELVLGSREHRAVLVDVLGDVVREHGVVGQRQEPVSGRLLRLADGIGIAGLGLVVGLGFVVGVGVVGVVGVAGLAGV